jgi:hypothetical protein
VSGLRAYLESVGEGHLWWLPSTEPPLQYAVAIRDPETGRWSIAFEAPDEPAARVILAAVLDAGVPPERATLWALVANDRLIAAAPELLACCRAMLDLHEAGSWGAPPGEYLAALRAAVEKASPT